MARPDRDDVVTSRLRLRGYDYSSPGTYFVTICTEHRVCFFGGVEDHQVVLSPAGLVIESWWCSIPRRFPGVMLDAYVVMPNHFHGLLSIGTDPDIGEAEPLPTLSDIVRWFKSMSTRDYILGVRLERWPRFPGRLWQERYMDHIVRSDASLERIRSYIANNPGCWQDDEHHPDRLGR